MSPGVMLAIAVLLAAGVARWQRRHGAIDLDALGLLPTLVMLLVGIAATGLAMLRSFAPWPMAAVLLALAAVVWPWRRIAPVDRAPRAALPRPIVVALVVVILGGAALRMLPMDYALAGRDQGTYTLRAEHTVRTGALDLHDPVLAEAHAARTGRAGPADVLGLLPVSHEAWRKDRYEGAYRPGLYLADQASGHVVPQFFAVHPMLLATAHLALGAVGPGVLVLLQGVVSLLLIAAVGRRLWPRGPWFLLPPALLAVAPLVIWVQRNALSETLSMCLLWAAVLATLRARDGDRGALGLAAFLLGGTAWVRGHGLLVAPAVAWVLLSLPRPQRNTARTYLAMVLGSVLVHAAVCFPYLHDEWARMIPWAHPTPTQLVVLAGCAALAWDGIDRLRRARGSTPAPTWIAYGPALLFGALAMAIFAWVWFRIGGGGKPFSRLDPVLPMLGPAVLVAGAVGIWSTARRRLPINAASVWQVACGAALAIPILLYARRNLPGGGLYYYGRYLVPELWPGIALASVAGVQRLRRALPTPRRRTTVVWGAALGLLAWTAWPLLADPATRIREFDGSRRVVEAIAAHVPDDAVVIAGGEGWHHGHTFNQVGGALVLSHGRSVVPYHSREAAYATLHERLVDGPAPDRPVLMLLNEATKPYRLRDEDGRGSGPKRAAVDAWLFPPFVARRVRPYEMFVHRLTPVTDTIPTRVTRDELRMALFEVTVDPAAAAAVERFAPPGGTDPRCLHKKKKTKLKLPPGPPGPVALVLVASPGTSLSNEDWKVQVGKKKLALSAKDGPRRPRDTLGPFVLAKRPKTLKVRGAKRAHKKAPCPHGGIDEIRILPLTADAARVQAAPPHSLPPPHDLGHPVTPARWVDGRGLSKARPGIVSKGGPLTPRGPSLVMRAGQSLRWPPEPMPEGGARPVDIVITLASSAAGPEAAIDLQVDGRVVATVSVPADRERSWQSEPIRVTPTGPFATLGVTLRGGDDEGEVLLRDLGVFSTIPLARAPP